MTDYFKQLTIRSHFFSCIVFMLPALTLATKNGIGVIEAAIVLAAIVCARPLWLQRRALFGSARFIIAAFAFNFAVAAVSLSWFGFNANFLESPSRQLLLVAAIGLIAWARPNAELFWHGLSVGALGAAGIAFYQCFWLKMPRAEGFHMPITFGDIALVMGIMSLASIRHFAKTRYALMPFIAFLAGLFASLLSGSRGGWLALVFSFMSLYFYSQRVVRRGILAIILIGATLFAGACLVPSFNVQQRLTDVSSDIHQYQLGNADTSLGARFEMWKGAWILFVEHPLAGVGRANYNKGLNELIVNGEISSAVKGFRHAHNEILNALATEGVIGGLAFLSLYAAPLVFFMGMLKRKDDRANDAQPYALAGVLLVLSFIAFGLTQVLFAHHVDAAFYALMVGVLAGICVMKANPEH